MKAQDKEEIKLIRQRMREAIRESGRSVHGFCKDNRVEKSAMDNNASYPATSIVLLISNKCGVTTDYILKGVR